MNTLRMIPLAIAAACALSAGFAAAQGVERGVAVVSEDVSSRISVFSYKSGPESDLIFRGTTLAPAGEGEAEVELQDGRTRVDVEVKKLPQPSTLGPFTTYVVWAITLDGRATNLGTIPLSSSGKGKLETSTPLAQFALIVNAEPHFAVTIPSKSIVLRNEGKNVKGTEETVHTLAERADYSGLEKPSPVDARRKPVSSELLQARYAMAIASGAAASQYAPDALAKADALFTTAESGQASKRSSERKAALGTAREATQAAEDARRAALLGKAASEEKVRVEAEARRREAEAAKAAADAAAGTAAAKSRQDLRDRLNSVLPTTETPRGLVAKISGVQFATGGAALNASARESLARFTGIVVAYPDIRYVVEGHTDSTGSEKTNTELSMKRAITVRDYLIGKGVAASAIDVAGLGPTVPVADNATAEGRAANRRVEIVMSGGPIGKK